jgi:hypothetical protein
MNDWFVSGWIVGYPEIILPPIFKLNTAVHENGV